MKTNNKQDRTVLQTAWTWLSVSCVHCARLLWHFGVLIFVVAAVVITVFRFWLPALADRKAEVEEYLSRQIGQTVVIGEMAADWHGLYPALHARKLSLTDADGKQDARLSLGELRLDLDIVPLLQGKLVFREITLDNPLIHLSRAPDGVIYIGKFKAPPPKQSRLVLLFNQQKVNISGGKFIWHDYLLKEKEFTISEINLSMINLGRRHNVKGSVKLPANVAQQVSLDFDIRGKLLDVETWNGQFNTEINQLELSALPGIVNEKRLIPELSGSVTLNASMEWRKGSLEAVNGSLRGQDLLLPLGDYGTPVSIKSVEADVNLEHKGKSWIMVLENPYIGIAEKPWSAGRITGSYAADESSLLIEKVKLADLHPVLDALTSDNKIVELVKSLYPSGDASDASLTLFGPINKPHDFLYKMAVSNGSVDAYKIYPSATGLQANISITRTGGSVIAEGRQSRLVLDRVYDHPLRVDDLQATVNWNKGETSWHVDGRRLWLKNRDAEAVSSFVAEVPFDKSMAPRLQLKVDLINGNLSHADHYYPVRLMKPGIKKWFEQANFRGRLNKAKLEYEGTAKGFPVAGADNFDVVANIEAGSMNFASGWPRLTGIDADLLISENDLWIKGTARDLYGQKVSDSTVHLSQLARAGEQVINVSTGLQGELGKVVEFLQQGPLFRQSAFSEISLAGKGHGAMQLDVSIPLADASGTRVKGEYKTSGASLQLPDGSWLNSLQGKLDFTERSLSSSGLKGVMLGGPIAIKVNTLQAGQPPIVELKANGEAHANRMGPLLGDWIARELKGKTRWQGRMLFDTEKISLDVSSDLKGLASVFPYPLAKESTETLPLQLGVNFLPESSTQLAFSMPAFVNGKLYFSDDKQATELVGGCLLIGKSEISCAEKEGLSVALEQPVLDLDPWDIYLKKQPGDEGMPEVLTAMSAKLGTAFYAGVNMADIDLRFDRQQDGSWQGKVQGDRINGDLGFNWQRNSRWVNMQLDRLVWNEAEKEQTPAESPQQPDQFPRVKAVIEDLVFHNMKLGRMTLQGKPANSEWDMQLLKLERPDMKVTANGRWREQGGKQTSSFDVDFTSTDMLSTLSALDFNIDFDSELFRTTGKVSWPGAPYDYELGILNGDLQINSEKGRLSSVEVGAGKLLGVFNVENLRRRLLLDFSDLSEEGFAFDSIDADMSIKQGIAQIPKLIMPGPSATIRLEGQLGLVKQDVDMKMSISPAVGGNLAVAGFVLGGPAGGVVTYLASKAIKKQMDKTTNYQYTIKGLWEDPVVDKIQSSATVNNQPDERAEPVGQSVGTPR